MRQQLELLPAYLTGHLQLTLVALLIATLVSVPLGIWATRVPWLKQTAVGVAGVVQTIPSLALLAIMVPLLSAAGLSGIGFLPALIGLTLYCVLPLLMGTITGIAEVDPAMVEAARGVGMTPGERLRIVELPLAMPVIVSGMRTAAIWCVGLATLSTPVGAPSLGNYIFGGLQTRNYVAVLVGCVAAAVLAQLLDRLVQLAEVGFRRRRRGLVWSVAATLGVLYAGTAATFAADMTRPDGDRVVIGAKTFTEQYILMEIMAERIEAETGLGVERVASLGSSVAFDALRSGDIDAYVDYSGTIWATLMNRDEVPADRSEVLRAVGEWVEREHGILLVAVLGFENTYALAMRATHAAELGVTRISELAPHARRLSIGGDYEFFERAEWDAITAAYGLELREQRPMDPALMYQAVAESSVDVIGAFSTDGRIQAYDLRVLADDRGAIPPYDAIVLASERLARERPEVIDALRTLDGTIDADLMRELNAAVDQGGRTPREVALRALVD